MELLYFASNLLFALKCKFSYRTKRKIEMEMKPLEITKLKCFCGTSQGFLLFFFFLITLLESSFFEPYFRFSAFGGQDRAKTLLKSRKLLVYGENIECNTTDECRKGLFLWSKQI